MRTWVKISLISYILIFCYSHFTFAQKQANHWFIFDFHLDFNHNPVKVLPSEIPAPECQSSISDYKGNLLFVTNNEIVFDKNLNPMPNGETGIQYIPKNSFNSNSLIVPHPGTSQFYIFMGSEKDFQIAYVKVDMNNNNGLGDVIQKAKVLPVKTGGKIVATGNCSTFWLFVADRSEEQQEVESKLVRYKIDQNGFNEIPDTIDLKGFKHFSSLTFSPDGKSLTFLAQSASDLIGNSYRSVLCDFNINNGKISNPIIFNEGHVISSYEFSEDCSKLYLAITDGPNGLFRLLQYDLSVRDSISIRNSEALIYDGSKNSYVQRLKLSPHGNIIFQIIENGVSKTGSIDKPNRKGLDCSFRKDAFDFYIFGGHTNFISTFLAPQFDENFHISAGKSIETCTNNKINLGQAPSYDIQYSWWPEMHLSNPDISNPIFLYNDKITEKEDLQYVLEGKKGFCYNTDTITITVHPDLQTPVFGSKSVCPGVTEVDYWADQDDRFRYEWMVDGGELVTGQHSDSIKVNWGPTNTNASVTLTPYNELNCPSPLLRFPVRINVELQTETPIGDELLCSNLAADIPYHITNTNGSVYTWDSDYGNILNGQGTNKISVNWPGDGKYYLWVREQSTTIDTVCYGVSDSLLVNLFTDSTKIEIDYAGIMREHPENYELQWFVSDTTRISEDMHIYASSELLPGWTSIDAPGKMETYFSFPDTAMNYTPMSFKITSVNGCQELIESEVHTTIFLEGMADSSSNRMSLSWIPYLGWDDHIEQYEIWYSTDNEAQMTLVASFKAGQNTWSNNWGADAFDHHYRIRALHSKYPFESWSNEKKLSFNHALKIPNVFTPNNDGVNDTFTFPMLELFHENEFQVFDRNGQEVYAKTNYTGDWSGGNLSVGVYYYSFTEKRNHKTYKGWVQILK